MVQTSLTGGVHEPELAGHLPAWELIRAALSCLQGGHGGVVHIAAERGSGLTTLFAGAQSEASQLDLDVVQIRSGSVSLLRLAEAGRPSRPLIVCVDAREGRAASDDPTPAAAPMVIAGRPVLWLIGAEQFEQGTPGVVALGCMGDSERTALAEARVRGSALPRNLLDAVSMSPPLPRAVVETTMRWQTDPAGDSDALVWPDGLVRNLGATDRSILAGAAMDGHLIDPVSWARRTDIALAQLIPTVARALQSGILVEQGLHLEFAHPLVRRSLLAQSEPDSAANTAGQPGETRRSSGRLRAARALRLELRHAAQTDKEALRARAIVCEADSGTLHYDQLRASVHLETPHVAVALLTSHLLFAIDLDSEIFARVLSWPLEPEARRSMEAARAARSVLAGAHALVEWNSIFTSVPEDRSPDVAIIVHVARALGEAARGRLRSALQHASRATELSANRTVGSSWWTARVLRARLLADLGRGLEALGIVEDALELADATGQLAALRALLTLHGSLLLEHGRFGPAERSLRLAIDLGGAIGIREGLEGDPRLMLARIAHVRGGQSTIEPFEAGNGGDAKTLDGAARRSRALSRLAEEETLDPPSVARSLAEAMSGTELAPAYRVGRSITDELIRIRLFLRAGAELEAHEVRRRLRTLAASEPSPLVTAAAGHAEGVLRSRPQPIALAQLTYERLQLPILSAMAAEDRADVGEVHDLVDGLREARAIYASIGATRETARLDRRLRDLGVRASDTSQPVLGLGLSRAEEKVARYVGEGMTNRAIADALSLSPNTVGAHLRRIYAKTGANDRTSLTALVKERQTRTDQPGAEQFSLVPGGERE